MGDQFLSMNGSPGFDFGTQINALDWYKKQQNAKLASGGLKNLTIQPQYHAVDNFGDNLLSRVPAPTSLTKEAVKKGTDKLGKIFENNTATGGFMNSKVGKFGSSYGGIIGDTASAIGDIIGKRGLDGKHGGITKGMDTAYDTVQKAASNFGPIGNIVSGVMGVGKLVGNAVSKIGGGTDGMTKTDAILNSAFLNLTPLGLINGFGGKKANTYTRNAELDRSTNGGFQGFLTTQDVTQIGAGKKYGLFSSGARNKQNQLTEFTSNMKHTISGIVDTNTINNLAAQGSTPFIANQQSVDLSGGVQQMRAAKHGMQFSRRVISKYQVGNKLKRTFKTVDVATGKYVEIPKDLDKDQIKGRTPIRLYNGTVVFMNGDGTVTSDRWEIIGQREHLTPKGQKGIVAEQRIPSLADFMEQKILKRTEAAIQKAISRKTPYMFKNPNWKNCIATATDNFGIPIVMRNVDLAEDPNKYGFEELSFGDNTDSLPDGVLIQDYNNPKNRNIPGHTIMLVGRTESGAPIYSYSSGDNNANSMHNQTRNYSFYWTDTVKPRAYRYIGTPTERESWEKEYYTLYPQQVPSQKQGGQMNVIPEGALHARLNHLDQVNDDLTHVTTKGIPVITKEGGEVIQHAEIEHSEIIFTLDVTNKIEDLRKKWHEDKEDKYAIEAGKLLVKEILHNTDDRTNLIESIE